MNQLWYKFGINFNYSDGGSEPAADAKPGVTNVKNEPGPNDQRSDDVTKSDNKAKRRKQQDQATDR